MATAKDSRTGEIEISYASRDRRVLPQDTLRSRASQRPNRYCSCGRSWEGFETAFLRRAILALWHLAHSLFCLFVCGMRIALSHASVPGAARRRYFGKTRTAGFGCARPRKARRARDGRCGNHPGLAAVCERSIAAWASLLGWMHFRPSGTQMSKNRLDDIAASELGQVLARRMSRVWLRLTDKSRSSLRSSSQA